MKVSFSDRRFILVTSPLYQKVVNHRRYNPMVLQNYVISKYSGLCSHHQLKSSTFSHTAERGNKTCSLQLAVHVIEFFCCIITILDVNFLLARIRNTITKAPLKLPGNLVMDGYKFFHFSLYRLAFTYTSRANIKGERNLKKISINYKCKLLIY